MNQNKIIAFFILLFFGIVFLVLSFLVRITRGKNKFLISGKIKIGMQIILLTSLLSVMGCNSCLSSTPKCYDTVPMNVFEFEKPDETFEISIVLQEGNIIRGNVYNRSAEKFTFEILDEEKGFSEKGTVLPSDGNFDSREEDIIIEIPETIDPGLYKLIIYTIEAGENEFQVYSGYINVT